MICHCDQDKAFADCCEPYISGQAVAPDPISLMRSRYSAYVCQDSAYLLATWHPDFRPASLTLDPAQNWLGLKIYHTETRGDHGEVKFVARYKVNGRGYRLEEHSLFSRIEGRWYYLHASSS
ncbi:MAG: YchJ family protein [Pseudomonadales bacterium]